jgi:hypothetical protein
LLGDLNNLQKNITFMVEGENSSEICEVDEIFLGYGAVLIGQ